MLINSITLEDLRRITVPTTILCGEMTTAPDRRVAEVVRDNIQHTRFAILSGAEHMSPLSHPDLVAEEILRHMYLHS